MARSFRKFYSEPAIGWNEDDFKAGVVTYGVANYESTQKLKVEAEKMNWWLRSLGYVVVGAFACLETSKMVD